MVSGVTLLVIGNYQKEEQEVVLPEIYKKILLNNYTELGRDKNKLFLKGYQWPFDVRKVAGGSSIIDVLVYLERCKGRRVYLDYRRNPVGGAFSYDELEPEARDYLTRNIDFVFDEQKRRAMELYWEEGLRIEPPINPG